MLAEVHLCRGMLLLSAMTGASIAQSTVSVPHIPIGTAPPLPGGKPHVRFDPVATTHSILTERDRRIHLRTCEIM